MSRSAPFANPVPILGSALSLDVGHHGACAILADQTLCWGNNISSRFGAGFPRYAPASVGVSGNESRIAIGGGHTCFINDETVYCTGANGVGELGRGSFTLLPSPVPMAVSALETNVVELTTGDNFSCAIVQSGSAYCWGARGVGQLGDGMTTGPSNVPVQVVGLSHVIAMDSGSRHTCAIEGVDSGATEGRVYCWGYNNRGQLGNGAVAATGFPRPTSILDAVAVTAGSEHSCAIRASGEVLCWGSNRFHQVGDGTLEDRGMPVRAGTFLANTEQPMLDSGEQGSFATCARAADGRTMCWGACYDGGCARGELFSGDARPVLVAE